MNRFHGVFCDTFSALARLCPENVRQDAANACWRSAQAVPQRVRHLGHRQGERHVARQGLQVPHEEKPLAVIAHRLNVPLPLVAISRIPHVHEGCSNDSELSSEDLCEPNPASKPSQTPSRIISCFLVASGSIRRRAGYAPAASGLNSMSADRHLGPLGSYHLIQTQWFVLFQPQINPLINQLPKLASPLYAVASQRIDIDSFQNPIPSTNPTVAVSARKGNFQNGVRTHPPEARQIY